MMKKFLSLLLVLTLTALCFTVGATAADGDFSLLPNPDGEMNVTGGTVSVDANGTVTITLTDTTCVVTMLYKDSGSIYEEAYIDMNTTKYVAYHYALGTGVNEMVVLAKYDRKDKADADLYLSGMQANPTYFKKSGDGYGVWDWNAYLSSDGGKRMPEDGIIKISNITYTLNGTAGSTVTLYAYDCVADYADDFGEVIPSEPVSEPEESSEAPVEQSSEAPVASSEAPSVAPVSSAAASSAPITADAGWPALAILALVALAGVVLARKSR